MKYIGTEEHTAHSSSVCVGLMMIISLTPISLTAGILPFVRSTKLYIWIFKKGTHF